MLTRAINVLIIEDDSDVRLSCEQAIELEGFSAEGVDSAEKARRLVSADFPGVIVSDIRLPGMDGLTLLRELMTLDPALPVVLMTGHGDITMAVQAMKDGAYDFIEKPFPRDRLVDAVRRAIDKRRLTLEVRELRRQLQGRPPIENWLIGYSSAMEQTRRLIGNIADTAVDVLIYGETGTGKDLVAQCLHRFSQRSGKHFVALNCGGLPDTLFESEIFGHEAGAFTGASKRRIGKIEHAQSGTLFLDEIESMPVAIQIKLLRFLQERTIERLGSNTPVSVDCRIVAASKENLERLVEQGRFRQDLFYRLNVATLELPPLRERREDIPLLFEHFVSQAATRHGREPPPISPVQTRELLAHAWPGNIRELRNVAECFVLGLRPPVIVEHADAKPLMPLTAAVEVFERSLIADELRRQNGSLARTSEALSIPKTTLYDKMRRYGLIDNIRR
ncbi:MAG: sigma-54-dependent Fis family transcriptional regulator [Candidatus Competibacteraceae bacterium]|nr:sigma-54-dependent Fis family transcriptional regulator [Candidatus Competibacteraceae bacterium]